LRLLEAPKELISRMMCKNVSGGMLVQTKKGLKSIAMPSNVPSMVVIDPKNAAVGAEGILKTMELTL